MGLKLIDFDSFNAPNVVRYHCKLCFQTEYVFRIQYLLILLLHKI